MRSPLHLLMPDIRQVSWMPSDLPGSTTHLLHVDTYGQIYTLPLQTDGRHDLFFRARLDFIKAHLYESAQIDL